MDIYFLLGNINLDHWQSFGYNIFSEINSFADNTFQYDRFIQNSTKTNIRKTNLKALFFDTL